MAPRIAAKKFDVRNCILRKTAPGEEEGCSIIRLRGILQNRGWLAVIQDRDR